MKRRRIRVYSGRAKRNYAKHNGGDASQTPWIRNTDQVETDPPYLTPAQLIILNRAAAEGLQRRQLTPNIEGKNQQSQGGRNGNKRKHDR